MPPDPRRDPTDPPKQRGTAAPGIPGLRLPSLRPPVILEPPDPPESVKLTETGGAAGQRPTWGPKRLAAIGGLVTAVAGAAVTVLQAWPQERPPEQPQEPPGLAALRERLDTVQAEQTQIKTCVRLLGEALCASNRGPYGAGWDECPDGVWRVNRDPPPLIRTDRVYQDCWDLLH